MNIFKGQPWDRVSTERAKKIAVKNGLPSTMWQLFLFEVNQSMIKELQKPSEKGEGNEPRK